MTSCDPRPVSSPPCVFPGAEQWAFCLPVSHWVPVACHGLTGTEERTSGGRGQSPGPWGARPGRGRHGDRPQSGRSGSSFPAFAQEVSVAAHLDWNDVSTRWGGSGLPRHLPPEWRQIKFLAQSRQRSPELQVKPCPARRRKARGQLGLSHHKNSPGAVTHAAIIQGRSREATRTRLPLLQPPAPPLPWARAFAVHPNADGP